MYFYIKSGPYDKITYTIDNDYIIINDRSIGVRVKRDDGVLLPSWVYFPRYTKTGKAMVEVSEGSRTTTIAIPRWLHEDKIDPRCRVVTR